MEYVPLLLSVLALAIAFVALSRVAAQKRAVEEAAQEVRRRAEGAADRVRSELGDLRRIVAMMAEGGKPSRDMVLEGRLWRDVGPDEGKGLVERGEVQLLDVRTPHETAGGIIPGAQLVPVDELETRLRDVPQKGRLLVYCAGGGRSAAACEFLANHGFQGELMNLAGGFSGWTGARAKP